MDFFDVLEQALTLLQRHGRVSYRALKRQFDLDDACLDDLKFEIVQVQQLATDQAGQLLVWTGASAARELSQRTEPDEEMRLQALMPAVIGLLQGQRRVTYRTLKYVFGIDDSQLAEIRNELRLRRLAVDEANEVLAWIGETSSREQPGETGPIQPHADAVAMLSPTPPPPQPTRVVPEAERRQLTVMFCDLVGSTDLSSKLDPEDLREVVRAYQETAAEIIERYEGHIAQYLGDGLLIYFGYPVAHEDDAQRAVHTGLGVIEAMGSLNTRLTADHGVALAVRLGIHTGPVVVGEMGGGDRLENLALGETPNIAARLEGLAEANTVVVSPVTAQLAQRSFELEAHGPYDLKGVAEPMMLYTVLSPRESAYDGYEAMMTSGFEALIGRDEEIGLLRRRWEQTKDGQGQVVLISGDAGLGKSSLLEGLRAQARQEGYPHLAFRCSPYAENSALHPVIEHVQQVLGWQRDDAVETRLTKLEQSLASYQFPVAESVPLLANLLSLPLPDDRYPPLELTPQQQRQHINDTLVAWMLEEAERQPLLAVWEDLHWADPSTLELLGLLINETPTVRIMNVFAYRPTFTPPWPLQTHLTPLALNRLERSHIEALARRLAGGKRLPAEVESHIVSKTDGVPLYVEEFTKMLLESEFLQEEGDQYTLTGPLSGAAIPDSLQSSLLARLDRLPESREVAQLGAVLGREFDYEMIQGLAACDESTLQASLRQLVGAELLYQRGRIPRAKYIFRHALIRDAAYQSLLRRTRQQIHGQVAEFIETQFAELAQSQPELVAYHYTEAGRAEPAVAYWQRAGQRAAQRSANQEAVGHLNQALEHLAALPDTPERIHQELDCRMALGPALLATQGFTAPEVKQTYDRARRLCAQLGETPQLFPVLLGLRQFYNAHGELETARELGEQLLRLAERQQDPDLVLLARAALGMTLYFLGEFALARSYLEQSLARLDVEAQRALAIRYGIAPEVQCLSYTAAVLWTLGYPAQAKQRSSEALTLAQALAHPFSLVTAMQLAALRNQFMRDEQTVSELLESLMPLAREHGFPQRLTLGIFQRGWVIARQGQQEKGIAHMRRSLADLLSMGLTINQPVIQVLLAEAYGEWGQIDEGLRLLSETRIVSDDTGIKVFSAEQHRCEGELWLRQTPPDEHQAETCFYKALSIACHQQAKILELRAAASLGKLWQSQGKSQEAYDLLAPIYDWFTEGFDTADLIDAKALLDALAEVAS